MFSSHNLNAYESEVDNNEAVSLNQPRGATVREAV